MSADADGTTMKRATRFQSPKHPQGDHASPLLVDARRKKRREGEGMRSGWDARGIPQLIRVYLPFFVFNTGNGMLSTLLTNEGCAPC